MPALQHTSSNIATISKGNSTKSNTNTNNIIDFNQLTLASLRKYKRIHHLRVKPTLSKAELVQVVTAHFADIPSPEQDGEANIIDQFVTAVRIQRQVVDLSDTKDSSTSSHSEVDDNEEGPARTVAKRTGKGKKSKVMKKKGANQRRGLGR